MYLAFAMALLCALALMVAPGYLALRALAFPRAFSLAASPAVGVAVLSVMGVVLAAAGVRATAITMALVPSLALAAVCAARRRAVSPDERHALPAWGELALYVGVGVAIGGLFYLRTLPSPNAIMQRWDMFHHANGVRAMADSGVMSPLHSPAYLTAADAAINTTPNGRLYPSSWHVVCALVLQLTGGELGTVTNATSFAFAFVCYPLSACLLLSDVFRTHPRARRMGSVACLMVVAFPWGFFCYGPILPNLAGMALVPALAALAMRLVRAFGCRHRRVARGVAWVAACLGAALLHPNAVFSMALFLVPWLAREIWRWPTGETRPSPRARALAVAGFLVGCAALWVLVWRLPAMQEVASASWWPFASPAQGVVNVLTLAYAGGYSWVCTQVVAGLLLVVGLVALWRDEDDRWLAVAYLLAAGLAYVDAVVPAGTVRSLLTGFWYNDIYRTAGLAAVCGVPALSRGVEATCSRVAALTRPGAAGEPSPSGAHVRPQPAADAGADTRRARAPFAAALAVVVALVFYPSFDLAGNGRVETAFTTWREFLADRYGNHLLYTQEERAFVQEALEVVGDDLVINEPFDGSILAYPLDSLRTYYRYFQGYGGTHETAESQVIRERLADIGSDPEVRRAVDAVGARYVLLLDMDGLDDNSIAGHHDAEAWTGIESIDDDTPGFTLVLESGKMRLYRIDGTA